MQPATEAVAGTSAAAPQDSQATVSTGGFKSLPLKATVLCLLLASIYANPLLRWVEQLWDDPNYSFGLLVIPAAVLIAYRKFGAIRDLPRNPSIWGMPVLLAALAILLIGSLGAELYLTRISLLLVIIGIIAFLYGWRPILLVGVPVILVWLVIPLPQIVMARISLPLQIMASRLAEQVLDAMQVPVFRDGNIISLPAITLGVTEACSGLRSIFSLLALTMLYAYFFERNLGIRLILTTSCLPIAVTLNVLRVTGTGLLAQLATPRAAEGFFHSFYGWLHFIIALGLVFLVHQALLWAHARVAEPAV